MALTEEMLTKPAVQVNAQPEALNVECPLAIYRS